MLLSQGLAGSNLESQNKNKEVVSNTGNDIVDQIKKLNDLKTQGILSEEEFQQKKEDLLAKM